MRGARSLIYVERSNCFDVVRRHLIQRSPLARPADNNILFLNVSGIAQRAVKNEHLSLSFATVM